MWKGEHEALEREAGEVMDQERLESFQKEMDDDLKRALDEFNR